MNIEQMAKVSELIDKGYVVDEAVSDREYDGGMTTPYYLKNPQDNTVVKVNIDATVEPYKPSKNGGALSDYAKKAGSWILDSA